MTRTTLRTPFLLGGAALLLVACAQEAPTDNIPAPTAQESQELAPRAEPPSKAAKGPGRDRHGRFEKGGPAFLLRAALKHLELRPDQETAVDGLMEGLKDADPRDSEAHVAFRKALAAQVRAGKLDDATLAPHYAAMEKEGAAAREKVHGALNTLHRTLDAEQRQELVAAVEQRMEARGRKHGRRGFGPPDLFGGPECAGGPDGECADNPDGDGAGTPDRDRAGGSRGDRAGGPRGDRARGPGGKGFHRGPGFGMLRDLDLSDAQKEQLRAARESAAPDGEGFAEHAKKRGEHMKKLLAAFASDRFDARALAPTDVAEPARRGAQAKVKHLHALLGVLEPAQREKLADKIEGGPPPRGH
jgi:Spy/CpxP family protein refolding chaperone